MSRNFLVIDPEESLDVLKAFASTARVKVLKLLHTKGAMNVNDIASALDLPQSTISSNIQILEDAGLIRTETQRARKGNQKICHTSFDQVLVMFEDDTNALSANTIEVAMPLGLYTSCEVSAPCGLCSNEGIIGLLDVPTHSSIRTACAPGSSGSPVAFLNTSFPTMPSSPAGALSPWNFPWNFLRKFRAQRRIGPQTSPCRSMV